MARRQKSVALPRRADGRKAAHPLSFSGMTLDTTRRARVAALWWVLIIVGFGVSAINGMLYKIVPFLVWLHLQGGGGRGRLTNMKEIIPDERARRQWWLHCAGLCLLLGAVWRPAWFAHAGALAFGLSCLLLWLNLLAAYRPIPLLQFAV